MNFAIQFMLNFTLRLFLQFNVLPLSPINILVNQLDLSL
jgi:hypothetical protein